MKHLAPPRLQAAAEGQALKPAERAHLRACADCRAERAALTDLIAALGSTPEPARALDQALLRRLGLGPPRRPSWRWIGWGLATALGVLVTLGRSPVPPAPREAPQGAMAKARPQPRPLPGPRRPTAPSEAAAVPAKEPVHRLQPPASIQAAPALGAVRGAPVPTREALVAGSPKQATPLRPALVVSVRNNLLKPGSGPLRVELRLPEPGPLSAVVYDQQGHRVAELYDGYASGQETLTWDGGNAPSGAYLLLLRSGTRLHTVHILLTR